MEAARYEADLDDSLLIAAVREALGWTREQAERLPSAVMDDHARMIAGQVAQNHEAAARSLVEAFRADQEGDTRRADKAFASAVAFSPSVLFQQRRIEQALWNVASMEVSPAPEPDEGPSAPARA